MMHQAQNFETKLKNEHYGNIIFPGCIFSSNNKRQPNKDFKRHQAQIKFHLQQLQLIASKLCKFIFGELDMIYRLSYMLHTKKIISVTQLNQLNANQ